MVLVRSDIHLRVAFHRGKSRPLCCLDNEMQNHANERAPWYVGHGMDWYKPRSEHAILLRMRSVIEQAIATREGDQPEKYLYL